MLKLRHLWLFALCLTGLLGQNAPVAAQDRAPDPRFGIVEAFVNSAAATEAGAGYTRVILRWDVIQPLSAADWKPANVPDPFIAAELAAGREVVGLLIGTPAWAAAPSSAAGAGARAVPVMEHWEAFTRRMAEHYRGRIRRWVIWNEPDVWDTAHEGSTWAGSEADYYRLLKTAYGAIKGVDPDSTVTLAGMTYFWDWSHGRRQYLDRLLDLISADPEAAGHGYYFDAAVYHLYFKPEQVLQVLGEVQSILRAHGIVGKTVWINETNAPPSNDPQELPWSAPRFPVSPEQQAAFIIQEYALAFAAGASRVEVYKLRNSADHPESIEPFGLLRADDSRRPAFDAYRVVTEYFGGFTGAHLQRSGDIYAVTFERGKGTTTVLWTMSRTAASVRMAALGPTAQLVDEKGNQTELAASGGVYVVQLPGAACADAVRCTIGGAPRLVVEEAPAKGRQPLVRGGTTPGPAVSRPSSKRVVPPADQPAVPRRPGYAVKL